MATTNGDGPEQGKSVNDEIKQAIDNYRSKNMQLQDAINHLRKENSVYKLKYNKLKLDFDKLRSLLGKSVNVLEELCVGTKNAFQMCKLLISSSPAEKKAPPVSKTPPPAEVQTRKVTRCVFQNEKINMQELREMTETAVAETSKDKGDGDSLRKGLSTISEEDTRELSVKLSRLPLNVVEQHLQKQNGVLSSSSSSSNESFASTMEPDFSSTPLKLEAMKMLGLIPSPNNSINRFVSVRKKDSGNRNGRNNYLLSPKKERLSSPEKSPEKKENVRQPAKRKNDSAPKNNNKKVRQSPDIKPENGRPTRKARPKVLKEESLKK